MRLNLLPDYHSIAHEPYDEMIDEETGKTIPILGRFCRGWAVSTSFLVPRQFGGWMALRVTGGAPPMYRLSKVKGARLEVGN